MKAHGIKPLQRITVMPDSAKETNHIYIISQKVTVCYSLSNK